MDGHSQYLQSSSNSGIEIRIGIEVGIELGLDIRMCMFGLAFWHLAVA
jgi:hypothetical protein